MTSNRNAPSLRWVLILSMTAFCGNQIPAVDFYQFDKLANLHLYPFAIVLFRKISFSRAFVKLILPRSWTGVIHRTLPANVIVNPASFYVSLLSPQY